MITHILNGDCLAEQLRQTNIQGQHIVCAECLIEGDLTGNTLEKFWVTRANEIARTYNITVEDYYIKSVSAFNEILTLDDAAEIYLWFENDLFCQVNMWFVLSLLEHRKISSNVFRIFPVIRSEADRWKGFGVSDSILLGQAFASAVSFTSEDIILGTRLWNAYRENNFRELIQLSGQTSCCFQYLKEVCEAHVERFPSDKPFGRPEQEIAGIIEHISTDFNIVFSEFSDKSGIYGFGDLQVRRIYDKCMSKPGSD